jgi:hypothetical protein
MYRFSALLIAGVLTGCGGGGDAADQAAMSITPTGQTWINCVGSIDGAVSRHVIVGGQAPFAIRSTSASLVVGTVAGGVFTPSATGQFGTDAPLIVSGSEPSVWVVTDRMACDSEGIVQVLDLHKAQVNITINTEAAEAI